MKEEKNKNRVEIYCNIMELIKIIDRIKEEEEGCNEGSLTDEDYQEIMKIINNILKKEDMIM